MSGIKAQSNGSPAGQYVVASSPALSFAIVIAAGNGTDISSVQISDQMGNVITNTNYNGDVRVAAVDVSQLEPAIYIITISNGLTAESQILSVNYPICPPYCP